MDLAPRRFGIALPQTAAGWTSYASAVADFARSAEGLGFDTIWAQEQILGRDPSLEPIPHLAAAAVVTSRIRLATAAIVLPRRHPVHLAKQLSTLDLLSGGRLTVGLALGDRADRYPAYGLAVEDRVARFVEGLDLMRQLWSQETATTKGRFTSIHDAPMEPKPIQQPMPVVIGAEHPTALRRAVELADGWVSPGGAPRADFPAQVDVVRAELDRVGRPFDSFAVIKKAYVAIEHDGELARARMRTWWDTHWGARTDGSRRDAAAAMAGTAEEVVNHLRAALEAGASEIALFPVYDERRHLETIASDVLPPLRG